MDLTWSDLPDLTQLIRRAQAGDRDAEHSFISLAYRHLLSLAERQIGTERHFDASYSGDLLHDTWLSRIRSITGGIADRNHFAALVSIAMREQVNDEIRRRSALKRTIPRETHPVAVGRSYPMEDLVALDRALAEFERIDTRAAQVVRLRYYGGCSWTETAAATGATVKAVRCDWQSAIRWLGRKLGRSF